jgi:hypothetical protein
VTFVRNADESLQIYLGAQAAYQERFKTFLAKVRRTYAKGANPNVDDALEEHGRTYVINEMLRALNWRDGAGAEIGLANTIPEAPVESAAKKTTRFLDYLGIEHDQCDAPLLIVEAKRFSSTLPRLASSTATPATMSELFALALAGEALHGEWQDWLKTLGDYARSVAAKVAMPRRVVITNGEWLVIFLDPEDAFSAGGTRSADRILVYKDAARVHARYSEVFNALEYSRICGAIEPIDVAQLRSFVKPEDVARVVHGLRLIYSETQPAFERDAPSPLIKVVPLVFVGTRSGGWLTVRAADELVLPHDDAQLAAHIDSVDASARTLLLRVNAQLERVAEASSIADHYRQSFASLPGVRRMRENVFQIVTGASTHFFTKVASRPDCSWHDWAKTLQAGVRTSRLTVLKPMTKPRAFFRSSLEQHCAHGDVEAAKATQLSLGNRAQCGPRSGEDGHAFCEIAGFEMFLCCRSCAFETVCTTATMFTWPCPSVELVHGDIGAATAVTPRTGGAADAATAVAVGQPNPDGTPPEAH